jgi:hypothetical protein
MPRTAACLPCGRAVHSTRNRGFCFLFHLLIGRPIDRQPLRRGQALKKFRGPPEDKGRGELDNHKAHVEGLSLQTVTVF